MSVDEPDQPDERDELAEADSVEPLLACPIGQTPHTVNVSMCETHSRD